MLIETNKQRMLAFAFENPTRKIHVRELARELRISAPSVLKNAEELAKRGLLRIERGALTVVSANAESREFVRMKRAFNLQSIYESGLVDALAESNPEAIVLFGSYSRGEDIERSDIDIAVISGRKISVDPAKFEKKLHRTVSVHEITRTDVSSHFWSNITNGIVLEGALR